jgi:uroporphyrinogen-III synthase|tara:strand:- start:453 stop:1151 length:699 start_codon:yes stop_codon:yes gene_type:complete
MHIITTRPDEDSLQIISKFQILGHDVTHLPLLNIKKINYKKIDFSNYKGLIFTSTNAIKFLETKNIPKNILCFCVGERTEKKARSLGFVNAICAGGNVEALKELILRMHEKNNGKLIYFSSETITIDLDKLLIKLGYIVDRIINYSAEPVEHINGKVEAKIKANPPDIIYVYSEKSAINLKNLIKKYSLFDYLINCNLMCISEKSSKVLSNLKWKKIFIFIPGEEEFLLYKI